MDWWHYADAQRSVSAEVEILGAGAVVDRDETFVYRIGASFYVVGAAWGVLQCLTTPDLSATGRAAGLAVSAVYGLVGFFFLIRPSGMGRALRAHPRVACVVLLLLVPVFVAPFGGYPGPLANLPVAFIVGTGGVLQSRAWSVIYGATAGVLYSLSALLASSPRMLVAHDVLGYDLVVMPLVLLAASIIGSMIGEASLASRSLEETLLRERARVAALSATLTRMRRGVSALVDALPAVERRAAELLPRRDAAAISQAAAKTRSRARDLHWSTVDVDRGAPTPLGEDLRAVVEWFVDHVFVDRATSLRIEIDDGAPAMLEQRAQNAVRAVLARALENVHDHAPGADMVLVRLWRDSAGATILDVEDDGRTPVPAIDGDGTRHSRKRIERDLGGRFSVSATPVGVRVRAEVPALWEARRQERAGELVTERVRQLVALMLRIDRPLTGLMVLGGPWIDSKTLTGHVLATQLAVTALVVVSEGLAWIDRARPGRNAALRMGLLIIGVALVSRAGRHPFGGYAAIVLAEVVWWWGWRVWLPSALLLIVGLVVSYHPRGHPGTSASLQALLVEGMLPVTAASLMLLVRRVIRRVRVREDAVRTTADRAQFIGELAYEVARAHDLLKPMESAVASRMPNDPETRHLLTLVEDVRGTSLDYEDTCRLEDSAIEAVAKTIAHRVHPARVRVTSRDVATGTVPTAADEHVRRYGARSTLLSVFAAAADKVIAGSPPGPLGVWRLEQVDVQLTPDRRGEVDVTITPSPLNLKSRSRSDLLNDQLSTCGGELLEGFGDRVIRFRLPANVVT